MIASGDNTTSEYPKKVAYIVSTLDNKGPTKQLFNLITNLDRTRYYPYIITLSSEPSSSLMNLFLDANIYVDSLKLSRIQGLFLSVQKLKSKLNRIQPDMIHTQGIRADTLALKLQNKYHLFSTIRNYPYDDYVMKFGNLVGKLLAYHHINIVKKNKNTIACSKSIANKFYQQHIISLDYVQNGINSSTYSPVTNEQKKQLREKLNIAKSKKIFIASGALISRKDPFVFIKAFQKANSENKAQLIVLGDGNLKSKCLQLLECDDDILLKGSVTNVADYLRASDVYISASKSEGLPNSVLEALGVGLPVILSDINPHMEILEKSQYIGISFQLGDIDRLAEIITEYISKDIELQSKKAREILCAYFSAETMSKKYQEKYDIIVNRD